MWVLIGLDDKRIRNRCRNGHQKIGVVVLDVVVMDVSRIDVTIMGGNSVDRRCMGDLGVRIEGGHDGRMVETVAVDDDGVGVHCRGFVLSVTDLVGRAVHGR